MPKSAVVRHGPAVLLGAVTVGASLALAVPLTWPDRWSGDVPALAAVSESRAGKAATATPSDLDEVHRQTMRTLAQRPLDSVAWARLAWIAAERGDTAAMRDALDRSYVAAPHGPEITAWRLRFAFDHWGRMTPDLRRQAMTELTVAATARPGMVETVRGEVRDPAGRWAMDLMVPVPR